MFKTTVPIADEPAWALRGNVVAKSDPKIPFMILSVNRRHPGTIRRCVTMNGVAPAVPTAKAGFSQSSDPNVAARVLEQSKDLVLRQSIRDRVNAFGQCYG